MKRLLIILLVCLPVYGQQGTRTTDAIQSVPFTTLATGSWRLGSTLYCTNCKRQAGPATVAGVGEAPIGEVVVYTPDGWVGASYAVGGGTGSVLSVGASGPTGILTWTAPVTTTGILNATFNTQTANTVLAGPLSGSPAAPTFRLLTSSDIVTGGAVANRCLRLDASLNIVVAAADCGSGTGGVLSVFGRTGVVTATSNDYTFAQINKTVSSLLDLTTRSAGDLSSGTLLAARMPAHTGDVTSSAGSVALTIAAGAVTEGKISLVDVTTNNSTTSQHGFAPKLSGNASQCYVGDGTWTTCPGAGTGGDFSSNTATSVDSEFILFSGTGGKTGKRATGTGLAAANAGVYSAISTSAGVAGLISDETGTGLMVFQTSPTIITPTIASFTNATHNHTNAAGGGQLTDAALSSSVTVAKGGTGLTAGTSGGIPYFSSTSTAASSALLAASQIVLGGGAGAAPATLGTLGTSTQVLHGNGAGAPTFGAVSLTADVTGVLPPTNGGTNNSFFAVSGPATSTKTFTFPNASSAVLTDNAAVTIAQGGTGQTGQTAAFNALDPLTTKGDLIAHDGTNSIRVPVGANGQVLTAASGQTSGLQWSSAGSGTVSVVGAGTLTSTAITTGGGTQQIQTPSATSTLDSSGNISVPGSMTTGNGGGATGFIDFFGVTSGLAVRLQAAASTATVAFTLPAADGTAGQCMTTNGSGVLNFGTCGSGTFTGSGTTNKLTKFTGATGLGNSLWTDDGTTSTYTGTGGLSLTGSQAGTIELGQGTAPTIGTTSIQIFAPTSVTSYQIKLAAAAATGIPHFANASNVITTTISNIVPGDASGSTSGSGNFALTTSPTFVTPVLGAASASSLTLSTPLGAASGGFGTDVSGSSGVPLFSAGAPTFTSTSGTGNFVRTTDPIFLTSLQIPNGANPTTDAFGEIAGDNNAWAASRGAVQWFDGTANTYLVGTLASSTPTSGQVPTFVTGGTITWQTPSGTGTVTASGGSLTSNAVVLGAGTTDTKVSTGITTDGSSIINLGVNATTIGKIKFFGNTSGDATIQPAAVAGTATVLTLPAVTGTLATLGGTETFTNKTLTSPTLTTPALGVATATSINKVAITAPATSATLTVADGKTLTANNSLTFVGTDSTTITFQATDTYLGRATTDTVINKTFSAEGTGNVLTTVEPVWLTAAGCVNATAGSMFDLPVTTPAVAACVTGTNIQKGVLDFADSGPFIAQNTFALPADWTSTGGVDATLYWTTTATSGDAKWNVSTACAAVNASATDDPAFNTAQVITTTTAGTASRVNTSTQTALTLTGCTTATPMMFHVKVMRDGTASGDTIAATARLIGVQLTYRRAQ